MGYKHHGGYHRKNGIGSLPTDKRTNLVMRIEDAMWIRNYASTHKQTIIDTIHKMVEREKNGSENSNQEDHC